MGVWLLGCGPTIRGQQGIFLASAAHCDFPARSRNPRKKLDDDEAPDSLAEMQVEIAWQGRTLGVPLAQLTGIGVNDEIAEPIADWHYWVAQGRQF